MSYFLNDPVYIIVPTSVSDSNINMQNASKSSFYSDYADLRRSLDNSLVLFKIIPPVDDVFSGYVWYNTESIKIEMQKPEWSEIEEL